VQAFEHQLQHRGLRLRAVRQPQSLGGGLQLGGILEQLQVGRRRGRFADLEGSPVLEALDQPFELAGGEVAAKDGVDGGALDSAEDLLLLALVERFNLDPSGGRRDQELEVRDAGNRERLAERRIALDTRFS
jgi:hypothetical protein